MPFQRPTLKELRDLIRDDIDANVAATDSRIVRSLAWGLSAALAGAVHLTNGFVEWAADQLMIDRATGSLLDRWAGMWGITRNPAVAWIGLVTLQINDAVTVPAGTVLVRTDGAEYETRSDAVGPGAILMLINATVAGADGNNEIGQVLELSSPIVGVDSEATVGGTNTAGVDVESNDDLRDRLLSRIRKPPQGGATADYDLWARSAMASQAHANGEPATVDNVWTVGGDPAEGDVTTYFSVHWDGDDPESVVPTASMRTIVRNYIDPKVPVGVNSFQVGNVAGDPIDMTIALTDDTADNRAAVEAELNALFQRSADGSGTGDPIENSEVRNAIGRGAEKFDLNDLNGDGTGLSDLSQSTKGSLMHLGTVTWT